jgi:hypothetical protein
VGHRRDVHGGTLRTGSAGGAGLGAEPAGGSAGVRDLAQNDPEDASVFGAARLSAATGGPAAQARAVAGRDRRHSERGQEAARQAASSWGLEVSIRPWPN